jgi:hypothetical protein
MLTENAYMLYRKDRLVNSTGDESEPENRKAREKRLAGLGFMKIRDMGKP